jgi:hypothetical protein
VWRIKKSCPVPYEMEGKESRKIARASGEERVRK